MIDRLTPTLGVSNLNTAIDFYTEILGLKLGLRTDGYATVETDRGIQIGLRSETMDAPEPMRPGRMAVGLSTAEPLEDVIAALAVRGIQFEPILQRGLVRLAFFGDPDGNALYLLEAPSAPVFTDARGTQIRPFLDHLELRWPEVTRNETVVEIDLRDDLRGPSGAVQGGITATLIDVAAATSAAMLGGGSGVMTTSMTIHYLAPGRIGPIRCSASIEAGGRRRLVSNVKVVDVGADKLIAVAIVGLAVVDRDVEAVSPRSDP